ncbi:hypothetical protein OG203_00560 [Nocardia sp. NBC_01499]
MQALGLRGIEPEPVRAVTLPPLGLAEIARFVEDPGLAVAGMPERDH